VDKSTVNFVSYLVKLAVLFRGVLHVDYGLHISFCK